jgi:hypothetical protein
VSAGKHWRTVFKHTWTPEHFPFSRAVPPVIARLLQEAAAAYQQTHHAEAILWSAQAIAPDCLSVYFSLYKFYFYKGRLEMAEQVVRQALTVAARQAGFDPDWRLAQRDSNDWDDRSGPQHFYLFSLKALAFICLRRQRSAESREILDKLAVIDPQDSIGAMVIRDLLDGCV